MKTFLAALAVLSVLCCSSAARAMPPPGFPPFLDDEEMRGLISQAAALALIHDLALTPEQREQIKGILEPVRAEIEDMRKAEKTFRDEHLKPRLKQAIADLKAGRKPAPPAADRGTDDQTLRSRVATVRVKSDQAFEQIKGLLSAEQREKLKDFDIEKVLGHPVGLRPHRLLCREPAKLIEEIRGYSQEDLDRLVERLSRRAEARRASGPEGEPDPVRDEKIKLFIELVKKIHAMPQSEFDAKAEALKQELAALSPAPGPGGRGDGGERRGHRHGPFPKRVFDGKRIIFSESFCDSL